VKTRRPARCVVRSQAASSARSSTAPTFRPARAAVSTKWRRVPAPRQLSATRNNVSTISNPSARMHTPTTARRAPPTRLASGAASAMFRSARVVRCSPNAKLATQYRYHNATMSPAPRLRTTPSTRDRRAPAQAWRATIAKLPNWYFISIYTLYEMRSIVVDTVARHSSTKLGSTGVSLRRRQVRAANAAMRRASRRDDMHVQRHAFVYRRGIDIVVATNLLLLYCFDNFDEFLSRDRASSFNAQNSFIFLTIKNRFVFTFSNRFLFILFFCQFQYINLLVDL
jgi:hypothetical protein